MRLFESLPQALELEALGDHVVIGPRQYITANDTVNQTQGGAAISVMQFNTSASVASSPTLGKPGQDILLGADEAVLVESLDVDISSPSFSPGLKFYNVSIHDVLGIGLPVQLHGIALPYIFPRGLSGTPDSLHLSLESQNPQILGRQGPNAVAPTFNYYISIMVTLVNMSPDNAVFYQRDLTLAYRRVQGLRPLLGRELRLSTQPRV